MLKLYTNTSFLTEEFRKVVFPLLFDLHYLKTKTLQQFYSVVDNVNDCDIVVFPIEYSKFLNFKRELLKLQKIANQSNKPIWIYSGGDYGFTNYIKNSYTFRLGGFDSKLGDKTFIIPSFINNSYENHITKEFSPLSKAEKPKIGFVGHAQGGIAKYLKEYLNYLKLNLKRKYRGLKIDYQPFYPSSIKRVKYLEKFVSSKIETNFILRNKYRAGINSEADKQKTTQEFYDNIFNNPYTFCIRGAGNFSVRFYETLAVGRIPVLLNTDCRLPLSKIIDWEKHVVVLDEKKEESLVEQFIKFHESKTETQFKDIQKSNIALWEKYLKRDAFFIQIHDLFINKKPS